MILAITTDTPPESLGKITVLGVVSSTFDIRRTPRGDRWESAPFEHMDELRKSAVGWTTKSGKPANLIYGLRITTAQHQDTTGRSGHYPPTLVVTMMATVAHAESL